MKYPLNILEHYIDNGSVVKQTHPTLPLSIYNYSRTTQFEKFWDEVTIDCRGLILDDEGNVVAKPFPKFFNYEEHIAEDSILSPIPNEDFEVYSKLDGSLGIIFHYNDEWHIATKGSFTSDQSIKGKELLDKLPKDKLDINNTYLVEILFAANRIVVDYGDYEGLILLGAYNRETGEEIKMSELRELEGWEVVKMYKTWGKDWKTLKSQILNNNEGYVIRFTSGFRMKLKGDEYIRLHRILTNISTKAIWRMLRDKEPLEPILERVPDEFDGWVKKTIQDLRYSCYLLRETTGKLYHRFRYGLYNDVDPEPTRKEYAEYVKKQPKHLQGIMFAMWDFNDELVDEIIWKLVEPKYEKPFLKNDD